MKTKLIIALLAVILIPFVAYSSYDVWNTGIPSIDNHISQDIPKMEQNFGYLKQRSGAGSNFRYLSTYGSFATAMTVIGSNETTLTIDENATISADTTVPATLVLRVDNGNMIKPDSGKVLTINATPDAGAYQIFGGSGTVKFGGGVSPILVDWFADRDLYLAYESATNNSLIKMVGSDYATNYYQISNTVTMDKIDVNIEGQAGKSSVIYPTSAFTVGAPGIVLANNGTLSNTQQIIRSINLDGRIAGTGTRVMGTGIKINFAHLTHIEDSRIQNMSDYGIYVNGNDTTSTDWIFEVELENTTVGDCGIGAVWHAGLGNANYTIAMRLINSRLGCTYSTDPACIGLYIGCTGDCTVNPTIDMISSFVQGGSPAIKMEGFTLLQMFGGGAEGSTGSYAYTLVDGNSTVVYKYPRLWAYGSWLSNGTASSNSRLYCTNCYSSSHNSYGAANVNSYVLGKATDGQYWGPPNQPESKMSEKLYIDNFVYAGTIWRDAYLVDWIAVQGGWLPSESYSDGNSSHTQKWIPIGNKIKIPIDHSSFDSSTEFNLFYPQRMCSLKEIEFVIGSEAWAADTASSLCVGYGADNNTYFTTTTLAAANLVANSTRLSTKDTNSTLYTNGAVLLGQWNISPVWSDNSTISVYSDGNWSAGTGYFILTCDYMQELGWGSSTVTPDNATARLPVIP